VLIQADLKYGKLQLLQETTILASVYKYDIKRRVKKFRKKFKKQISVID
jgi:hypothetical protein